MTFRVVVALELGAEGFSDHALSTVTAAQNLAQQAGTDVTVVVVSDEGVTPPQVEWDIASMVTIHNTTGLVDGLAAQRLLEGLLEGQGPVVLLMPHVGLALEVAPGLAASGRFGFGANLQTLAHHDEVTGTRSRFGGKVVETLAFDPARTTVVTIRDGAFDPSPQSSGQVVKQRCIDANAAVGTRRLSLDARSTEGVDITKADVVLSIGRGIGDESNVARFAAIADGLGATLAASRPLVDVGWVEPARQVGQSGRTVKPKVYLAFGISGSIQHVAGMRSADTIVAVNTDADAPIFEIAHYGAVMDVNDLASALESELATH